MRNQTARARAFINFLVDAFGEPFWDRELLDRQTTGDASETR
jgi:hypothetical protein